MTLKWHLSHWMSVKWCNNNGTMTMEWLNEGRMRNIFERPWFFHSHSGLIPSFLMRKNEKKQISGSGYCHFGLSLNEGPGADRGKISNQGQPIRFFSSSFQFHLNDIASFHTHSIILMSLYPYLMSFFWHWVVLDLL